MTVYLACCDMLRATCPLPAALPVDPSERELPAAAIRSRSTRVPPEQIDPEHYEHFFWGDITVDEWQRRFPDPGLNRQGWFAVRNDLQAAVDSRQRFREFENWDIADARRDELRLRSTYVDDKSFTWRGPYKMSGHVKH